MIEQMLVLSTAHLTEETCNTFLPAWDGPAYQKGEYGWFVYGFYGFGNTDDLPTDLEAVLQYAMCCGVEWLMFDRDASTIPNLPTFDW
jgi:hypothetical protein